MGNQIASAKTIGGLVRAAGMSAVLLLGCAAAVAQLPTYRIVQILPPSATTYAYALNMNDSGDVIGNVTDSNGLTQRPAIWPFGSSTPTMLTIPPGAVPPRTKFEGYGYGINNTGQMVGFVVPSGRNLNWLALKWTSPTDATILPLGLPLSLKGSQTSASRINDSGIAIGMSNWHTQHSAQSWSPTNELTHLGSLSTAHPPPGPTQPSDINAAGTIVGDSTTVQPSGAPFFPQAFTWTPAAGMQPLQSPLGIGSHAQSINGSGTIVGWLLQTPFVAALWTPDGQIQTPTDMPMPIRMNNAGQVLGAPFTSNEAIYWTAADGAHNVIDLVDKSDPLYPTLQAVGVKPVTINEKGWLLVINQFTPSQSFLLIPE